MYLTASNLAHYLIGRRLITAESVVGGDFMVVEASRRNRNFKLIRKAPPGLFIKQITSFSVEAIATLQREAAFYDMVRSRPAFEALARLVPRLVDYNPAVFALAVELIPGGENLIEYHIRLNAFPEHVGEMLGQGLGIYHSQMGRILNEPVNFSVFPRQIPWILTLDPTTLLPLTQFGAVGEQLTAVLRQQPGLLQGLLALRYEWQLDSLIHGDIKWDNCLVTEDEGAGRGYRIVDWELVDLGDASWDVASIFTSYLAFWILTMGGQPEQPAQQVIEQARGKFEAMRPAMRAFWQSYAATRGLGAAAALRYLERCMRFCAARLVLAVFEYLYGVRVMNANTLTMLQVSQSIFLEPQRAVSELLGL